MPRKCAPAQTRSASGATSRPERRSLSVSCRVPSLWRQREAGRPGHRASASPPNTPQLYEGLLDSQRVTADFPSTRLSIAEPPGRMAPPPLLLMDARESGQTTLGRLARSYGSTGRSPRAGKDTPLTPVSSTGQATSAVEGRERNPALDFGRFLDYNSEAADAELRR